MLFVHDSHNHGASSFGGIGLQPKGLFLTGNLNVSSKTTCSPSGHHRLPKMQQSNPNSGCCWWKLSFLPKQAEVRRRRPVQMLDVALCGSCGQADSGCSCLGVNWQHQCSEVVVPGPFTCIRRQVITLTSISSVRVTCWKINFWKPLMMLESLSCFGLADRVTDVSQHPSLWRVWAGANIPVPSVGWLLCGGWDFKYCRRQHINVSINSKGRWP